ncbi:MAG: pantetheine-phosphate adenylyltransferase [Opitutales bacterium]|nr:pantetheine-phosphate adenylyltransferase [Opitutales bacterium]
MATTKKERIALYPGSFDPVHNGHLHLIERAAKLFDRLYVGVAKNPGKNPLFSEGERVELLKEVLKKHKNVRVVKIDGLTVDAAEALGATVIVRGLRLVSDFEDELLLDMHNRRLNGKIETVYMMPTQQFLYFNSSFVKQIVSIDPQRLGDYVPAAVLKRLLKK